MRGGALSAHDPLVAKGTFQRISFQLCANLCLHKIMLLAARFPREACHFMRETSAISSLLGSAK
jgi:hypothetical protein